MTSYAFGRTLTGTVSDVRPHVEAALAAEGFGILTEIDVQAVFAKKLGLEHRPYLILGACNPGFASQAIAGEPHIGLLLPCNVVLQEERPGITTVSIADPVAMFSIVDSPEVEPIAVEVRDRLKRALAAVEAK